MKAKKLVSASVLALIALPAAPVAAATELTVATDMGAATWAEWAPQMNVCTTKTDVTLKPITGYDFGDKIFVQAAAGEPLPDVLVVRPELFGPIIAAGLLENLDPLIKANALDESKWLPGAVLGTKFAGKTWGLPAYVINYTYAYNKDLIGQAGVAAPAADEWISWDRVRTIAKKTTADTNGDGKVDIWGFVNGTPFVQVLPLIRQAGGSVFDDQGRVTLDTAPARKAVEYLNDLTKTGVHTGDRSLFWKGAAATERMGSWEVSHLAPGVNIASAAGMMDVTKDDVSYVTAWALPKGGAHEAAAFRFISCLMSKASQDEVVKRGRVPMRRDVTFPRDMALLAGFLQTLEFSRPYPLFASTGYVLSTFDNGMKGVFAGQEAADSVLPQLEKTMNAHIQAEAAKK